jgi:hypothetical protein
MYKRESLLKVYREVITMPLSTRLQKDFGFGFCVGFHLKQHESLNPTVLATL